MCAIVLTKRFCRSFAETGASAGTKTQVCSAYVPFVLTVPRRSADRDHAHRDQRSECTKDDHLPKNILIFSDGTGQIGGIHPDQRLSNIYKLYRAMRPGPSSPINPADQVAFYDPGLGGRETGGGTIKRLRNLLESAVGTGIDDNVIDCYEKIISYYEPGDKILLFGFSRGAYTARTVANVMNLCGIPTKMPDGSAVPKFGPKLRQIATDAVKYVYNHGTGYPRGREPYLKEREEKGRRFRVKYGSSAIDGSPDVQGNIQPTFVGVFDTVAALGNIAVTWLVRVTFAATAVALVSAWHFSWPAYAFWPVVGVSAVVLVWYFSVLKSQFMYFSPDPSRPLNFSNPLDWLKIWRNGHRAVWRKENYDRWLDSDVGFARHALAIDEHRAEFPRVSWAMPAEADKNKGKNPTWLKQIWFPGCHSDIGGSYPEPESRLSDIALDWMVRELKDCVPEVRLVRYPDPYALQHEETFMFAIGPFRKKWAVKPRVVDNKFALHPTVIERLKATAVPQVGDVKPYRPSQLAEHPAALEFFAKS
jgi:hypothetical protein